MQPAPKIAPRIDGVHTAQAVEAQETATTQTANTPVQEIPAQKSGSINDIIRRHWEKYAESQGIDPRNPPKPVHPKPQRSIVGQRCGHHLVVKQMEEMLKRAKEVKKSSSKEVPSSVPGPMELAGQQFCGQHFLAQKGKGKIVKALKE